MILARILQDGQMTRIAAIPQRDCGITCQTFVLRTLDGRAFGKSAKGFSSHLENLRCIDFGPSLARLESIHDPLGRA